MTKKIPSETREKRKAYQRNSETQELIAPGWSEVDRLTRESVSILAQKVRRSLRQNVTQLDKEIRQVKELVRMVKDIQDTDLKVKALEAHIQSNGTAFFYEQVKDDKPKDLAQRIRELERATQITTTNLPGMGDGGSPVQAGTTPAGDIPPPAEPTSSGPD